MTMHKMLTATLALSFAAGALFVAAPAVHAEDAPKKAHKSTEERFKAMDTDNDGKVTLAEFKASHKNKAGASEADAKAADAKAEEYFKKIDANGDGSITLEEMKAFAEKAKAEHKKDAK
jgi:Ca2+-binding EF-hand superfamily protein